ncbi:polysaccharide deacetylase [Brucella sp. IR073]|uniref:polysaccharide deacetylase n=1 Tax=unclassified Brucella TaxID=2632610 RepID=UPI003B97EABA
MPIFSRFVATTVLTLFPLQSALATPAEGEKRPPQYVLISFDGAHDNRLWRRSMELGQKAGARFTYFLSCVFLIQRADRARYHPPGMAAGRSNVGFAFTKEEIAERLGNIWTAHSQGHEIASHGCGHFDGTKWSAADWDKEVKAFRSFVADAYSANGIPGEPQGWRELAERGITGFRAPYLATGKQVQQALIANGFRYQASGVTRGPELPERKADLASFGLPMIPEGPSQRPVIAMDYNLYVRHSGGFEKPSQAQAFEDRTYQAFKAAFEKQYDGSRIPLQLGFHFVEMNAGAYWRALERFAMETCTKPGVQCITYSDYLQKTARADRHAEQ